jgi:hypothetical protein
MVGTLAVLIVAVLGIAALTRHHTPTAPSSSGPAVSPAAAPVRSVSGVRLGYPDTAVGAEAAAANYVVAFAGQSMFTTATRHQIIAAITDPAVTSAVQAQYDTAYAATLSRFGLNASGQPPSGEQFVARALPVGVDLQAYSPTAARVSVWSDGLIGLAGTRSTQPVSEAWTTTDVSLAWVSGDWKWLAAVQTDGPTPVAGLQSPSSAAAIAAATRSYGGLGYAP